jgi:hypothetical protein
MQQNDDLTRNLGAETSLLETGLLDDDSTASSSPDLVY